MCNINILVKKKGHFPKLDRVLPVIEHATGYSFVNNSDGEGAYFSKSKKLKKGRNKIHYGAYADDIDKSRTIITHQRISTSGFSTKYTQPFMNKDFVLVHNGVMSSFVRRKKSDTFIMFGQITEEFRKSKLKSRERRIIKAIQTVLDGKFGSYSIFLYDRVTGLSYYFKNSSTNIHFFVGDYLFISTSNMSVLLPDSFKQIAIQPDTIYRIDYDLDVWEVGKIQPGIWTWNGYGKGSQKKHVETNYNDTKATETVVTDAEYEDFIAQFDDWCFQCGQRLSDGKKYKIGGAYYCQNCRPGGY